MELVAKDIEMSISIIKSEMNVVGASGDAHITVSRWELILKLAIYILEYALEHFFKLKKVKTEVVTPSGDIMFNVVEQKVYHPLKWHNVKRIISLIGFAVRVIKRICEIFK